MKLQDFNIITDRLDIRLVSETYREQIFQEFSSDVTKYMYPAPAKSISDTDEFIATAQEELINGTDINVVILHKDTKDFLGGGGLHKINIKTPEFGIWIKKSAHGNGYGREAITALKSWADQHLRAEYYVYPADKRNISSRKIAESLGGVIVKEFSETNMSGNILDEVEYHIPVTKNES